MRYGHQRISGTAVLDENFHHRRLLYLFTYIATLISLQILYLALDDLQLLLGLSGAVTAGFVYSYYVTARFRAITTYSISLLAVGLSIYYAFQIHARIAMYGNYLGVLLGILTALLAYKAFSPHDHRFILMVCVVFLLFSSVASYDLKFLLLLPLFLVAAGLSLYIANQIEVAVRVAGTTGQHSKVRFRIGLDFLWMLARATVGVILLSVIFFVITPHSTKERSRLNMGSAPSVQDPGPGNDDLADDQDSSAADEQAQVGIGDDFDLTDTRQLTSVPTPVLQLKSHRPGYLRAQVYDVYTGSGWVKSPMLDANLGGPDILRVLNEGELANQPQSFKIKYVPLADFPSPGYAASLREKHGVYIKPEENVFSTTDVYQTEPGSLNYDVIRQEITLLENQPPYYFAMYQPFRLENISQTFQQADLDIPMADGASILRPLSLKKQHPVHFTYTVYSLEPRPKPARLAEVYTYGPPEIVERYTQLPLDTHYDPIRDGVRLGIPPEQYRPISRQLINYSGQFALPPPDGTDSGPLSVYAKVLAIYQHLLDEDEYTYSRQFDPIDSSAELTEAFVMGTRSGYCRYFASAMAVMCRINGIPSRVVSGYSPGTFSLIDNAYIYRASNAHAWVEVYIDGYGWLMFDPSPGSSAGPAGAESRQFISGVIDFLQNLFIIDPAGTQQLILGVLGDLWQLVLQHWVTILGTMAGVVALALLALVLQRRRRRTRRHFEPENPVIAAYVAVGDELARLGHGVSPGLTARGFFNEAAAEYQPVSDALSRLLPVYEQAAFSPAQPDAAGLQTAAEVSRLISEFVADELQRRKQRK